uniref:CobW C-terminal domain-containing protein n=1 Tax=Eutreptiella gymnastica TaxID=73025 RepID=A0A7S4LDA5_9EUGL
MDSDDDCPNLIEVEPTSLPPPNATLQQKPAHTADGDTAALGPKKKVPVTILTGFLGSGKTTLLHYILTANHDLKIAVIMNEFSIAGAAIEKQLTLAKEGQLVDDWVEMPNGCICCSAKGEAVSIIETMLKRKGMDHVIIETSGLADPGPIVTSFWVDEALESSIFLDGVITVVDAKNIAGYLATPKAHTNESSTVATEAQQEEDGVGGFLEATQQIAYADKLIINKADLVNETQIQHVQGLLRRVNAAAEMQCASFAVVEDVRRLLHINSLALDQDITQKVQPSTLPQPCGECNDTHGHGHGHEHGHTHVHTDNVGTSYVEFKGWVADEAGIERLMTELLCTKHTDGFRVMRMKALLHVQGQETATVLQAVADMWDTRNTAVAITDATPVNKVVFIGRNLHRRDLEGLILRHCGLADF